MSRIIIRAYDGDAAEYDWDQDDTPENIGNAVGDPQHYRDGEEMLAVKRIVELIDEGGHFDVRQWAD